MTVSDQDFYFAKLAMLETMLRTLYTAHYGTRADPIAALTDLGETFRKQDARLAERAQPDTIFLLAQQLRDQFLDDVVASFQQPRRP